MQSIHIEPEELYLTSRAMWQQSQQISQVASSLQAAVMRLEMAWLGGSAEEVISSLQVVIRRLRDRMDELERLGLILSREAERWQESDQVWSRVYRDELLQKGP